jgi:hypothetical protein
MKELKKKKWKIINIKNLNKNKINERDFKRKEWK